MAPTTTKKDTCPNSPFPIAPPPPLPLDVAVRYRVSRCTMRSRFPFAPPSPRSPSVRPSPTDGNVSCQKDSLFQKYIFLGFIYAILRLCAKITQFKVIFATTECPTQIDSPQTFLMPLASAQSTRLGSVPVSLWAFSLQWDSTVRLQQIWGTFSVWFDMFSYVQLTYSYSYRLFYFVDFYHPKWKVNAREIM